MALALSIPPDQGIREGGGRKSSLCFCFAWEGEGVRGSLLKEWAWGSVGERWVWYTIREEGNGMGWVGGLYSRG